MAKSSTPKTPADPGAPRAAISVTSRQASFRRAGRTFYRDEPTVIPVDELTEAEYAAIEEEPSLVVEPAEIRPVDPAGTTAG